ncbi:unnamed protein product [Amoebophrya sp. A120]|nr:unnamed protein product [Amoebophrya sp. A120]|eukprot:GSA120T00019105001.1
MADQYVADKAKAVGPGAVGGLLSDLKMMAAFESAAQWDEAKLMDKAFSALSWEDPLVASALPKYLASSGATRSRVDYAFNALVPKPPSVTDGKQAMMHTWLKARLFAIDSQQPFELSPYGSS